MCEDCVKEEFPDRGSVVTDSGAYLANLSACVGCGQKDTIKVANKTTQDTSNQEVVEFDHVCSCGHVVAHHEYRFWLEDNFQYYEMSCRLCGEADDSRSCLPDDPRQALVQF